ncbi:hypothetical protein ACF1GW_25180 [Streptomyces achromogenes]
MRITQMAKDNPPMLSVDVVSGCYRVPDGQQVEHFWSRPGQGPPGPGPS